MENVYHQEALVKAVSWLKKKTQSVQVQKHIICFNLENTPISGLRVAYYWGLGKLVELSRSWQLIFHTLSDLTASISDCGMICIFITFFEMWCDLSW